MTKKLVLHDLHGAQIKKKNLIIDTDFAFLKNIRVFFEVLLESKSDSFRMVLWMGEDDDGSGKRIEFTDLFSSERLEMLPSRKLRFFIPAFLQAANKDRYLEEITGKAILADLNLEIYPARSSPKADMVSLELTVEKARYFSSLDLPFKELSEILRKTNPD